MSLLVGKFMKISEVKEHPLSSKYELVEVKGGQVCVKNGEFKAGDLAFHIPANFSIPEKLASFLGITEKLLNGKVQTLRFIGGLSNGVLISLEKIKDYSAENPQWGACHVGV